MPETHTVRDCTLHTLTTYAKSVEPLEAHIKNFTNCNLILPYLPQQICKGKTAVLISSLYFDS